MTINFFFRASLPSQAPDEVIFLLRGIHIVRGDYSDLFDALNQHHGPQPSRVCLAVIDLVHFIWIA